MKSSYLVDSHCHLNFQDFNDDFEKVLIRAEESNVKIMVSISTELDEIDKIIKISEKYSNIYCTVGVHPHSTNIKNQFDEVFLEEKSQNSNVIGIGETGLDFYYENSKKDDQIKSFKKHINVSRNTQLPIIIHTREADDETCLILEEETKKGEFPGIIHCFTAGDDLAKRVIDLGFYISLSGIVTFKNANKLRETIKNTLKENKEWRYGACSTKPEFQGDDLDSPRDCYNNTCASDKDCKDQGKGRCYCNFKRPRRQCKDCLPPDSNIEDIPTDIIKFISANQC